jgi:arsenical pump membrane protein
VTGAPRLVTTIVVFATMLVLVAKRPRGWNEAWWPMLGAAAMLALGFVSPRQALSATLAGKNALLFLLSLLAFSLLVGKSGFFEWAAIHCARMAHGDARALYRNTFVLGAIVTAMLSLDTTAVMLTPIVLALVKRLKLSAAPYIVLCAFVANVGSLLLPISNLTNILFADTFHLTFAVFAAKMVAPQLVALVATFGLLRWYFHRELPQRFEYAALPQPASVVPNHIYFVACATNLVLVVIGYFLAPFAQIEPYVVAFAGSGVLVIVGAVTGRVRSPALRELAWGVFPFVVGLFVAVEGLENLGIVAAASDWLARTGPKSARALLQVAGAAAATSNLMNNLPAALIAQSVLLAAHAHTETVLAALVGADAGSIVTPFGSLATILVLALAQRDGEEVPTTRFMMFSLWATPLIVLAAALTLAVNLYLSG